MVGYVVRYRMLGVASFPFLIVIGRSRSAVLIEVHRSNGSELVPDVCF